MRSSIERTHFFCIWASKFAIEAKFHYYLLFFVQYCSINKLFNDNCGKNYQHEDEYRRKILGWIPFQFKCEVNNSDLIRQIEEKSKGL